MQKDCTSNTCKRWQDLADKNLKIKQQVQSRLQKIAEQQCMIDTLRSLLSSLCMPRYKNSLVLIKTRQQINNSNRFKKVQQQLQEKEKVQRQKQKSNYVVNDDIINSSSVTGNQDKTKTACSLASLQTNTTKRSTFYTTVAYFKRFQPFNERLYSAICDPFRQAAACTHSKTFFASYCDLPCSRTTIHLRQLFQYFPPISWHSSSIKRKRSLQNSVQRQHISENNTEDDNKNAIDDEVNSVDKPQSNKRKINSYSSNKQASDTSKKTIIVNSQDSNIERQASSAVMETNTLTQSTCQSNAEKVFNHNSSNNNNSDNSDSINENIMSHNVGVQQLQNLLTKYKQRASKNVNHFVYWRQFVHTSPLATKIVAQHFTDMHALLSHLLVCYAQHLLICTPQASLHQTLCSFYSVYNHRILKQQLQLMTFAHVRNCDDVDLVGNSRVALYKKLQLISLQSHLQKSNTTLKCTETDLHSTNIIGQIHDSDSSVDHHHHQHHHRGNDIINDDDNDVVNEDIKNAQFAQQASHTLLACYLACKSEVFVNTSSQYGQHATNKHHIAKSKNINRIDQSRLKPHETVALLLNSHAAVDVRKINLMKVEDVLSQDTVK